MNNDGRITDPNNRVVNDDYVEVGDRERIIDDNDRRLAGTHRDINGNRVVGHENDNIINDHDAIDRTAVKHMTKESREDLNADPITGEPGSHPIGTGIGGVGGAAAGAAIGTMAGPLGTLIGGAIGAIVGGGVGHAAAEAIDPTREEAYWRAEYANTDYYKEGQEVIVFKGEIIKRKIIKDEANQPQGLKIHCEILDEVVNGLEEKIYNNILTKKLEENYG